MTPREAENRASKLQIDGKILYELSPEQWLKEYGIQGQTIYIELQESVYGHVRFSLYLIEDKIQLILTKLRLDIIGPLSTWLGKFLGLWSFSPAQSNISREKAFMNLQPLLPAQSSLQQSLSATTSSASASSSTTHDSQKNSKYERQGLRKRDGRGEIWSSQVT